MRIIIFDNQDKTFDRYTVIIENDVYFMSYHPDRVNEVCSYDCNLNQIEKFRYLNKLEKDNVKLNKIPKNLKYQIRNIIKENRFKDEMAKDH